ncbi:MAG: hypothetical protein AB1611_02170, partial [bacterium]
MRSLKIKTLIALSVLLFALVSMPAQKADAYYGLGSLYGGLYGGLYGMGLYGGLYGMYGLGGLYGGLYGLYGLGGL